MRCWLLNNHLCNLNFSNRSQRDGILFVIGYFVVDIRGMDGGTLFFSAMLFFFFNVYKNRKDKMSKEEVLAQVSGFDRDSRTGCIGVSDFFRQNFGKHSMKISVSHKKLCTLCVKEKAVKKWLADLPKIDEKVVPGKSRSGKWLQKMDHCVALIRYYFWMAPEEAFTHAIRGNHPAFTGTPLAAVIDEVYRRAESLRVRFAIAKPNPDVRYVFLFYCSLLKPME